jgi:DNA mismatch endonuclease (patch repair protein)
MDTVSSEVRSNMMGRIRSKGTKPELAVRRAAFGLGYRYRLNRRDLPGTPDLVFKKHRTVIFVHGCYWHRHNNCKYCYFPKSNTAFWQKKFEANVERDRLAKEELEKTGWRVVVIWECETTNLDNLSKKLEACLN